MSDLKGYNPLKGPSIYNDNVINKRAVVGKSLNSNTNSISLLSLSFLFSQLVSYSLINCNNTTNLELKINGFGYTLGQKFLEKITKERFTTIISILQFIHTPFYKYIFNKTANELEKSQSTANEYMIIDNAPIVSQFILVPKNYGNLNCAAFIAGIIEGALDAAGFYAVVAAHSSPIEGVPGRTVFLIKFNDEVIKREELRQGM